jgi:hypothetical protein
VARVTSLIIFVLVVVLVIHLVFKIEQHIAALMGLVLLLLAYFLTNIPFG